MRWLGAAILTLAATSAQGSVWTYDQAASTVPGLSVSAEITLAGNLSLADLPTVSSSGCLVGFCPPPDFAPITAFSFSGPGEQYSLGSFTYPDPFHGGALAEPNWSISPGGIEFHALGDAEFEIDFALDTVRVVSASSACFFTNCTFTGAWIDPVDAHHQVPEPAMLGLFALALGMITVIRRVSAR